MRRSITFLCGVWWGMLAGMLSAQVPSVPAWINYTNTRNINGFAEDHDFLWIATEGGLVRLSKTSGEKKLYNRGNSGIPSNMVRCVEFDQYGKLWIGTDQGIGEYDGHQWKRYGRDDYSMISEFIRCIACDNGGNKWFGTDYGLLKYDGNTWTTFFYTVPINSLLTDQDGSLWVGTENGLHNISGSNENSYSVTGQYPEKINALAKDHSGNLWVGTSNFGLWKYDTASFVRWSYVPSDWISAIRFDDHDKMWLGVADKLVKYDGISSLIYQHSNSPMPQSLIKCMFLDRDNCIWLGFTDKSDLLSFDGNAWTQTNISFSGLPGNYVSAIATDSDGNKWMGTEYGLVKFDGMTWTVFDSLNPGSFGNYVTAIAIDHAGVKWVGTWNAGFESFDEVNSVVYNRTNSGLPDNHIGCIAIERSGVKWFGTPTGLTRWDGISWMTFTTANSALPNNQISCITIDKHNNKWIGTSGGGVAMFNDTSWTIYNTANSPLTMNWISGIAVDSIDQKWIVTQNGAFVLSPGGGWEVYPTLGPAFPGNPLSVCIDARGVMWFGTIYHLVKYDGITWTHYDVENSGVSGDAITSINVDRWGNIWMGSGSGLTVFNEGGVSLASSGNVPDVVRHIFIFPNPSPGKFTITGTGGSSICIYDVYGNCVLAKDLRPSVTAENITIDLSDRAKGIYFVRVGNHEASETRKIIIQ